MPAASSTRTFLMATFSTPYVFFGRKKAIFKENGLLLVHA
jgi:hypothetical protein